MANSGFLCDFADEKVRGQPPLGMESIKENQLQTTLFCGRWGIFWFTNMNMDIYSNHNKLKEVGAI